MSILKHSSDEDHNQNAQLSTIIIDLSLKAPLNNPTFTGNVGGITAAMVGLSNVDNTADIDKPISTAQQAAMDMFVLSGDLSPVATTGLYADLVTKPTKADLGLGNVDNTSDALKPISTATQQALNLKVNTLSLAAVATSGLYADLVTKATKGDIGLSNVDNTSDILKPISTATQTALNLKAPLNNPTFTGNVGGITASMVGLSNVNNTSDSSKPISTATQTALNLKAPLNNATFTGTFNIPTPVAGSNNTLGATTAFVTNAVSTKADAAATTAALALKADLVGGKVPDIQLPDTVLGQLKYQGTWNMATALPAATSTNKGWFYIASNTTTQNGYSLNDWALSNGTTWERIANTGAVIKVAGLAGDISVAALLTALSLNLVNNTADIDKPISTATAAGLLLKAPLDSPHFTGIVAGITAAMVGLNLVNNTADIDKPISTATQIALDLKAAINNATFTGTFNIPTPVAGSNNTLGATTAFVMSALSSITKGSIGLGSVDNTSDILKPISTAQQSALDLKAPLTLTDSILANELALTNRITALETTKWVSLEGVMQIPTTNAPSQASVRGGNCKAYFFAKSATVDNKYRICHDYVLSSDLYLQLHWGHTGTSISGNIVIQVSMTYAKGYNQSVFPAEVIFNLTIPATNLTIAPRYGHITSEVQISSLTPAVTQLDSSLIEPGGRLLVNTKVTTNPTISGGTSTSPYWLGLDLVYLSTGHGTKNRKPNYYV